MTYVDLRSHFAQNLPNLLAQDYNVPVSHENRFFCEKYGPRKSHEKSQKNAKIKNRHIANGLVTWPDMTWQSWFFQYNLWPFKIDSRKPHFDILHTFCMKNRQTWRFFAFLVIILRKIDVFRPTLSGVGWPLKLRCNFFRVFQYVPSTSTGGFKFLIIFQFYMIF